MSSMIRSMQRNMIRQKCYKRDGNTKAFRAEWEKFKYRRDEIANADGTTTTKIARRGQKRKSIGRNRSIPFVKRLNAVARLIKGAKAVSTNKANAN